MINKEKAIGIDNFSLKPLLKIHALHVRIKNYDYYEYNKEYPHESMSKQFWSNDITQKFASRLVNYYDWCLSNEELPAKQNLIRQIFLKKTEGAH